MVLNESQIRQRLTERPKRRAINDAIAHQNRIKFHAQTTLSPVLSQPLTDFLTWVGTLIPADKLKIFKSLFRYPVKTNEVTGICFDKLSRVFDGRNPAYNYQFISTEQRDDWEYYRQEVLNEPCVWQTKGWEQFQTEINSVLVVDMPVEPSKDDRLPQPYFYWLNIDGVLDYEVDPHTGNMSHLIFKQPDNKVAVIDEESYRIYTKDKSENIGAIIIENRHGLGYCPARFFWSEPMSLSRPDVKRSPLTNQLESLDWYLFFHLSKRHLDLYGAYPIYSGYEQSCDFTNAENGDYCDGGFLKDKHGNYKIDTAGLLYRCPKCGEKRIAGVGSFVEIPIPGDNQPDLRNPVQMLAADVSSLQYNVEEENRLKDNIIQSTIGVENDIISSQALNEKQVAANFESQSTILNRVKKGFEDAQKFVDETICRLRYGSAFVSARINLGTEFFTLTPAELRERYKTAKESGASEAELDALHAQIIETEYRNNPTELQRMLTLADIEPLRHYSRSEALDLFSRGLIDEQSIKLKLHFTDLIRRFERENINVLEFGTAIPYDKKINIITQKLKEYVSQD